MDNTIALNNRPTAYTEIYITDHSEYHLVDQCCVSVRNPKTGKWHEGHRAVGAKVIGGLYRQSNGGWRTSVPLPTLGDRIVFDNDTVTSPLRRVERTSIVQTESRAA